MKPILFLLIFLSLLSSCSSSKIELIDLKKYFDEFQVQGCFVLYDLNNDKFQIYNQERSKTRFSPASTFKIFNTLAALETSVAADEKFLLRWDGITREVKSHNQDQTLKQAFQNSTVWYYQELARRIGYRRMQSLIDQTSYGNKNIQGAIDQFWLNGELRISPLEQIVFLKKLYLSKVPFSKRTIDITKKIMIKEQNQSYTLRAKTGTTSTDTKQIAWYVGYIERDNNVYIFAMNIESPKPVKFFNGLAVKARVDLAEKILQERFQIL